MKLISVFINLTHAFVKSTQSNLKINSNNECVVPSNSQKESRGEYFFDCSQNVPLPTLSVANKFQLTMITRKKKFLESCAKIRLNFVSLYEFHEISNIKEVVLISDVAVEHSFVKCDQNFSVFMSWIKNTEEMENSWVSHH